MDIRQFDENRYLSLSTFRKTGVEVKTPVWFASMGDKLYVFTAPDSGKVKRLRNSSRARIAPCDARGNVKGEWRDATARLVSDPDLVARAHKTMRTKYGWQMAVTDFGATIAGRIRKRAYIEIDY
jgi:PPOX class probable F420-dependent enzyme